MKIQSTAFSVAEIKSMFERGDLVVNKTYQRNSGIWPANARSYFIDTILNGYPFPKVYFYEVYDRKQKKIRREIVDGQQRIATIIAFSNDQFSLTSTSNKFKGRSFPELSEDIQADFMSYSVAIDNILSADTSEILEMFRRMNSLTVALNPAEKRHSQFLGEFKWFINELADTFSPFLVSFGVLTQKQALRMADADILTEVVQLYLSGIVNRQDSTLRALYRDNDAAFEKLQEVRTAVSTTLDFVRENLGVLSGSFLFKGYVFYSLCAALLYNRFCPPPLGQNTFSEPPLGRFWIGREECLPRLHALATAHESGETDGPYGEYVKASVTTHRVAQRKKRTDFLLRALNGTLPI